MPLSQDKSPTVRLLAGLAITLSAVALYSGFTIVQLHSLEQFHWFVRAHLENAPAGAMQVEVWGQQFTWYMRYPGADGRDPGRNVV